MNNVYERRIKTYYVSLFDGRSIDNALRELFDQIGKKVELKNIFINVKNHAGYRDEDHAEYYFLYEEHESDAEYAARLQTYQDELNRKIGELDG